MPQLAVVIGRFQYQTLTPGHLAVLEGAAIAGEHVLILVGRSPTVNTRRDPLSYELRADMLRQEWKWKTPFTILPLDNHPSNVVWAGNVDRLIDVYAAGGPAVLIGGEDSCDGVYKAAGGKHPFRIINAVPLHATELRAALRPMNADQAFRSGVVWAAQQRFVSVFQCVDVLIYGPQGVLLAHKAIDPDGQWRLVGGFVDPEDKSLEDAVRREVAEETGLKIWDMRYAGSARVYDWRYTGPEIIMTAVFVAEIETGSSVCKASDDIDSLKWFSPAYTVLPIVSEHQQILNLALKKGLTTP